MTEEYLSLMPKYGTDVIINPKGVYLPGHDTYIKFPRWSGIHYNFLNPIKNKHPNTPFTLEGKVYSHCNMTSPSAIKRYQDNEVKSWIASDNTYFGEVEFFPMDFHMKGLNKAPHSLRMAYLRSLDLFRNNTYRNPNFLFVRLLTPEDIYQQCYNIDPITHNFLVTSNAPLSLSDNEYRDYTSHKLSIPKANRVTATLLEVVRKEKIPSNQQYKYYSLYNTSLRVQLNGKEEIISFVWKGYVPKLSDGYDTTISFNYYHKEGNTYHGACNIDYEVLDNDT